MPDGKYSLDPTATLAGAEILPLVQAGADKKTTINAIRDYILQNVSPTELSYLDGASNNIQTQINSISSILSTLSAFTAKQAVVVATTGNTTLSGLSTIDGYTLVDSDRVLVWKQTTKAENGIYVARAGAWERALDFNAIDDLLVGAIVPVIKGDTWADKLFMCTTDSVTTMGTSAIEFAELGSGDYLAKTGAYTATKADLGKTLDCDGTFTVDLPSAVGVKGKVLIIKNSGAGTITVDGNGSETIDGAATKSLAVQYEGIKIQSTGANWIIVGKF